MVDTNIGDSCELIVDTNWGLGIDVSFNIIIMQMCMEKVSSHSHQKALRTLWTSAIPVLSTVMHARCCGSLKSLHACQYNATAEEIGCRLRLSIGT